jgi:hypothetical protein
MRVSPDASASACWKVMSAWLHSAWSSFAASRSISVMASATATSKQQG